MMSEHMIIPSYGLWSLVIINSLVFIIFAFSFAKPINKRDWRSFSAFSAFIVALFAEMYGFPLTIYLFSGWLSNHYPSVDFYSHENGHLWHVLLSLGGDPHWNPIHLVSFALIIAGFVLLSASWKVLYSAQKNHQLATTGPYARIRHPQYVGFFLIMLGFLVQWPTLLTLLMFPILTYMYVHLAKKEEREAVTEFGAIYEKYAAKVPAFIPLMIQREAING
ncbi:MAG: isoprenylcysteine carboxylmethyltransferase family protein [Gammaproteobacteria bacterium]|nr:isoprenylcysteine carboxylmethyltransferase family protein [Gammaproteobacteria bacterium]